MSTVDVTLRMRTQRDASLEMTSLLRRGSRVGVAFCSHVGVTFSSRQQTTFQQRIIIRTINYYKNNYYNNYLLQENNNYNHQQHNIQIQNTYVCYVLFSR